METDREVAISYTISKDVAAPHGSWLMMSLPRGRVRSRCWRLRSGGTAVITFRSNDAPDHRGRHHSARMRSATPGTVLAFRGHQDPWSAGSCVPRRVGRGQSAGLYEPHRNPTTPRPGGRSPQESHGRNGTLRYTCYAC